MSREVVIQSWCDVCQDADARTPATFAPVLVVDGKPFEIDLCDEHAEPVRLAIGIVEQHGRRPQTNGLARPALSNEFDCDLCDRSFPTKQGLSMHQTRTHNLRR